MNRHLDRFLSPWPLPPMAYTGRHPLFRLGHAFLVLAILLLVGCGEEKPPPFFERKPAPELSLTLFDGSAFLLSEKKGKPVLINFFASWCISCGEESPTFKKLQGEYEKKGVVFLAVAVQDTEDKAKEFLQKHGLTLPAGLDTSGVIKKNYQVFGMPTTVFIDKQGIVNYIHIGLASEALIRHELEKIL